MKEIIHIVKEQIKCYAPVVVLFFIASVIFVPYPFNPRFSVGGADTLSFEQLLQPFKELQFLPTRPIFWHPNIFSGMPTVAIFGGVSASSLMDNTYTYLQLLFSARYDLVAFFLSALFFFIFCRSLRMSVAASVVSALAYSFTTYNPILVSVGHLTKFQSISFYPAVAAGTIFLLEGAILEGALLLLLFTFGVFSHQQITYYTLITGIFITVYFLQKYIREKQIALAAKRASILIVTVAIGALAFLPPNLMLLDYNKQTLRGGGLDMGEQTTTAPQRSGLDIDYAFSWSYAKTESFTFIFPGVYGYGSRGMRFDEQSSLTKLFQSDFGHTQEKAIETADSFGPMMYWGDAPFVEGPIYLGVLVCLLALIAIVFTIKTNKHVPWLLGLALLSLVMAWGKHLMWFNELLFNYLPFYNKFRVPSMILVVTQLAMCGLAGIGLDFILNHHTMFTWRSKALQKLGLIMGGTLLIGLILYVSLDFTNLSSQTQAAIRTLANEGKSMSSNDLMKSLNTQEHSNDLYSILNLVNMTNGDIKTAYNIFNAIVEDRQRAVLNNVVVTFWYFLAFAGLLLLLVYKKIKPLIFVLFIGGIVYLDLFFIGRKYLSKENYKSAEANARDLVKTPIDEIILQDKDPNFRVFDVTLTDPFGSNETSAFHKSVGGYHAAKLSIYNDLIRYQLSKFNMQVFNMLNTKYFIQKDPKTGEKVVIPNPDANGNCWFVSTITLVDDDRAEMKALDTNNSKTTAVVQKKYSDLLPKSIVPPQASDYIKQTYFSCDTIRYEYEIQTPRVAVFSEIFNPYWQAKDETGKELSIFKTNYVLRGLQLAPGKHTIEFVCYPKMHPIYASLSKIFYYLNTGVVLLLLGFAGVKFFKKYQVKK